MNSGNVNIQALDSLFGVKKKRKVNTKVVLSRRSKLQFKDVLDRKTDIDLEKFSKEELRELLAELDSEYDVFENCRLRLYKPNHEVALALHKSLANVRIATGGNRSGKTQTGICDYQIRLTGIMPDSLLKHYPEKYYFPGQRLRIVSTDFINGIDKIIVPMFRGAYAWFPQEMIVDWDTKARTMLVKSLWGDISMVEFMSYDQDVTKFQGASRHGCLYDEEPPKPIRDECKMRVMDVDGGELFSMTPTKGLSWTLEDIYNKRGRQVAFEETRELIEGDYFDSCALMGAPDFDEEIPEGDEDFEAFVFYSTHNPNINQERVQKDMLKMDETERKMRIFGEYISKAGRVFDKFTKAHICKPFEIPQDWPRYMSLDPHARTPHAVVFIAVDSMGRKWVYDELWTEESCTTKSLVLQLYSKEFYQVPDNLYNPLFPEGFQYDKRYPELYDHEDDEFPAPVKLTNHNGMWMLEEPVQFLRPWIVNRRIDPAANIPNPLTGTSLSTDLGRVYASFVNGSKDIQRRIMKTNEEFESGTLFVFSNLKHTLYELNNYVWDDFKGPSNYEKTPKQKPKDKDDHFMEAMTRIVVEDPIFLLKEDYDGDIGNWRQH